VLGYWLVGIAWAALFLIAVHSLLRRMQDRYAAHLPSSLTTPWLFAQGTLRKVK
jgi:hypothetical protein